MTFKRILTDDEVFAPPPAPDGGGDVQQFKRILTDDEVFAPAAGDRATAEAGGAPMPVERDLALSPGDRVYQPDPVAGPERPPPMRGKLRIAPGDEGPAALEGRARATVPEATQGEAGFNERREINRRDQFERGTTAGAALNTIADAVARSAARQGPEELRDSRLRDIDKGIKDRAAQFDDLRPWYDNPTLGGKINDLTAAVVGGIQGSLPTPESFIAPGAKLVTKALSAGAINAGADVATQGVNIWRGAQDEYDGWRTAIGTVLGAGIAISPHAVDAVRRWVSRDKAVHPDALRKMDITQEDVAKAVEDPDVQRVLEANGVKPGESHPALPELREKLAARREAEAQRATGPAVARDNEPVPGAEPIGTRRATYRARGELADAERVRADVVDPEVDPAAQRTAGLPPREQPAAVIEVTPDGTARAGTQAEAHIEPVHAKVEELRRAQAALAEEQLGMSPEQFARLTPEAQHRVAEAAERQAAAKATEAPPLRVADTSGEARTSAASRPMDEAVRAEQRTDGAAENANAPKQPTGPELDASSQPYARTAAGNSDRPFVADTGEHAAHFEERARAQAEEARRSTQEDLEARWREYEQANARSTGAHDANASAPASNKPAERAQDGRWQVNDDGHVVSDKGGPVIFGDQRQAANWIVNEGHKLSPDQVFEIANHPSGRGYTVRQRDIAAEASGPNNWSGSRGGEYPSPAIHDGRAPVSGGAAEAPGTPSSPRGRPDGEQPPAMTRKGDNSAPTAAADTKTFKEDFGRGWSDAKAGKPLPEGAPDDGYARGHAAALDGKRGTEGKRADAAAKAETKRAAAGGPAAPEPKATPETPAAGGGTLYSNPLDPGLIKRLLIDPIVRLARGEIAGWHASVAERADLKGSTALSTVRDKLDGVLRTARFLGYSGRGVMKGLAERYGNIPEVRQMLDHLASDPGSGRVVGQTLQSATTQRVVTMANRLRDAVGERHPERDRTVVDILAGRRRPDDSEAGKIAKRVRALLDEQYDYMKAAGMEVGYVRGKYFPRVVDAEKVQANPEGFKAAAEKLYRGMGLDAKTAAEAATDWHNRALGLDVGDWAAGAGGLPFSAATKGRTLPASADRIMADFYHSDLRGDLAAYLQQTSRKAEFARRFGAKGEKAQAMFDAMAAGGMKPADAQTMRAQFDSATGMMRATMPTPVSGMVNWLQTHGTIMLLPRIVISALAEPLTVGVRTGSVWKGLDAFARTVREYGAEKAGNHTEARQVAEMLGVVGDAFNSMMVQSRMAGGNDTARQRATLAWFFKKTQVEDLTAAQRVASTSIGQQYLKSLLEDAAVGEGKKVQSAHALLGDLGIAPGDVGKLRAWLAQNDGVPKVTDLLGDSREVQLYRGAVQRFVNESIQAPEAVDRPYLANHAYGRMAYGIMSFNYAFTRNVLIRTGKVMANSDLSAAQRVGVLAPFLVLAATQMGVADLRDRLLNPEGYEKKTAVDKVFSSFSRASLAGAADPIVNLIANAKYEGGLMHMVPGAQLGAVLDAAQKMTLDLVPSKIGDVKTTGKNNPDTNNAEWAATKAAWTSIASPLAAAALARMPGGPVLQMIQGVGIGALSAPITANKVANTIVGEKTVKSPGGGSDGGGGRSGGRSSSRGGGR